MLIGTRGILIDSIPLHCGYGASPNGFSSVDCPNKKANMNHLPEHPKAPVVYTMGKVGSSSLTKSVWEAGRPCFDIHTLDEDRLLHLASERIKIGKFPHPHVAMTMAWWGRGLMDPERCSYITVVRDPVERNLSAFFQNRHERPDRQSNDPKKLFEYFLRAYPHGHPIRWFDNEYKRFLGIDVLAKPFDKKRRVYREEEQLLVLRLDASPEIIEQELSATIGAKVQMRRANIGAEKGYAELYRAVKEIARYDSAHLDALYDTPFARVFWTDGELEDMRRKWLAR